jgi:hypothetical protein
MPNFAPPSKKEVSSQRQKCAKIEEITLKIGIRG